MGKEMMAIKNEENLKEIYEKTLRETEEVQQFQDTYGMTRS